MIGIKAIASYLPPSVEGNFEKAVCFGEDANFVLKRLGVRQLPKRLPDQETSDLAQEACKQLFLDNTNLSPDDVDLLVVITQNPDGEGLPHTSAILQQKIGLKKSVAAFDISLGCSGYVYGIAAITGFMKEVGFLNGILVTADPYSKVIDSNDRTTSMLFGDAATATWIGKEPDWILESSSFGTDGEGARFLQVKNNTLNMNGRQIYNFAKQKVAVEIKNLIAGQGIDEQDVGCYILHQGSAAVLDAVIQNFPDTANRFVRDMELTGNTVSSSIPLILQQKIHESELKRILLCGFGVGLSWASATIVRR